MPLTAKSLYGAYSSTPIISNGVIYSQDLESNVQAISLQTGKVLWTKNYESADQGPNGLSVGGGRVYGATATSAFALNEKTGAQLWSVELVPTPNEGIDMAPGYHNGIVYIATVPGNNAKFYAPGGVGILWALEASSGKKLWHFDTAPENLWGAPRKSTPAGAWVHARVRRTGLDLLRHRQSSAVPGHRTVPVGIEPARSRPLHRLAGKAQRRDRQAAVVLPTGATRPLRPDLQDPPILMSAVASRW